MNWQERREKRFEKWLNPPGVTFENQEAEENYRANPDNFQAMIQTAKEYGVYGRN